MKSSPYIRLYCSHVSYPNPGRLSVCHRLQRVSREHSCAGGDLAGRLDYCDLPALRPKAPLLAGRDLSGKAVASGCGAAGPRAEVTRGPNEEGNRSRGAGAKERDGGAGADDRPVRIDAGNRRVDHCGREAGKGSGHQKTVAAAVGSGGNSSIGAVIRLIAQFACCPADSSFACFARFLPHRRKLCVRRELWNRSRQILIQPVPTLLTDFPSLWRLLSPIAVVQPRFFHKCSRDSAIKIAQILRPSEHEP